MYDLLQDFMHILAGLGGYTGSVHRLNAHDILNFLRDIIGVRARQVDLVDDRNALKIMVQGEIHVPQSLGLHPLCRVDDKDSPVTCGKRAGNFIIKVHVSRRVDQVEDILLPVVRFIDRSYSLRLDGDASLSLKVHVIQDLLLHLTLRQKTGHLNDPVSQSGLAMVNMGYNTEISDFTLIHEDSLCIAVFEPREVKMIVANCRFIFNVKRKSSSLPGYTFWYRGQAHPPHSISYLRSG